MNNEFETPFGYSPDIEKTFETFIQECGRGNYPIVEKIIEETAIDSRVFDIALKMAAKFGHVDIASLLIQLEQFNTLALDQALFCASNFKMIEMLVEEGASNFGFAAQEASKRNNVQLFEFFISKSINFEGVSTEIFNTACCYNSIDVVKFMLERGNCDVNCGLEIASRQLYVELVELMIQKGANSFDRAFNLTIIANRHGKNNRFKYWTILKLLVSSSKQKIECDENKEMLALLYLGISIDKFEPNYCQRCMKSAIICFQQSILECRDILIPELLSLVCEHSIF